MAASSSSASVSHESVPQNGPLIPVSTSIRLAVERSICAEHYQDFRSFHDSFMEFKKKIDDDWEGLHAHLISYFPPPPKRVGKTHWKSFQSWLEYGLGGSYKTLCLPWVQYGLSTINACEDCKITSQDPPPPQEIIVISDDEVDAPQNEEPENEGGEEDAEPQSENPDTEEEENEESDAIPREREDLSDESFKSGSDPEDLARWGFTAANDDAGDVAGSSMDPSEPEGDDSDDYDGW